MEQAPKNESSIELRLKQVREIVGAYKIGARPMHEKIQELGITEANMSYLSLTNILLSDNIESDILEELHRVATVELAKISERKLADALYNLQPKP